MVTVFGLGFVGLTTALGFAHLGYEVYGLDVDEERKRHYETENFRLWSREWKRFLINTLAIISI